MKIKKLTRFLLICLLLLNSLGALFAGYGFIMEPDGSLVGLDKSALAYSPFTDFLIPGIILFVFNGLSCLLVLFQIIKNKAFAAYFLFAQGLISCGWIGVQVIMLRSVNMLHFIFGMIGMFFLINGYQLIRQKRTNT